jgi:hypothetical protein
MDDLGLRGFVRDFFCGYGGDPLEVPVELAREVVFGSVEYARSLGFDPHPDFAAAEGHLGSWTGPGTITFGKDGKPLYICGPCDDPRPVIRTLERTAGSLAVLSRFRLDLPACLPACLTARPVAARGNAPSDPGTRLACQCCPAGSRSTRGRRYPSDMTDAEWAVIEPLLPAPGWTAGQGGSPGSYCRRDIVDGIRYLVHNGCVWRALPAAVEAGRRVPHCHLDLGRRRLRREAGHLGRQHAAPHRADRQASR